MTTKELLERALRIEEKEYGPSHREVAKTLANLGNAHGALGDAVKQKELLERALRIKEKEYGPDHREVAITKFNLAMAHAECANFETAMNMMQEAHAIFVAANHPLAAQSRNALQHIADLARHHFNFF